MSGANEPLEKAVHKPIAELFAEYLRRQVSAHAAGLEFGETAGEVMLYEAAPVQATDPRLAWNEALAALASLRPDVDQRTCKVPPDWSSLVSGLAPVVALPLCVGNFPQMVRSFQPLLRRESLKRPSMPAGQAPAVPGLQAWADEMAQNENSPGALIALGTLRLAGQFEAAVHLLKKAKAEATPDWQAIWANEEAALAWHRGDLDEAAALWQNQPDSIPVLFNRGMAALFLGRAAEARSCLSQVAVQLPEASGWRHLAQLYLALAEMRD